MKIVNIKKLEKKVPTVDIEVSETHSYQLENGVVSHNTLSLLAGEPPGANPGFSTYMIRRVQVASNDPLIEVLRSANYHMEYKRKLDGTEDRKTFVVDFPCKFNDNIILTKDMNAIAQLEMIKKVQTIWSDSAVSCTVYYKKEELPEIREWLKNNYENCVKSVSFLLHTGHGFDQAPLEEITKEEYEKLISKVKPICDIQFSNGELLDDFECTTGHCPIK